MGTLALPSRFAEKVDFDGPNGCWLWTAATNAEGYGRYSDKGHLFSTHRFAYSVLVGPIPAGIVIDHTCFNAGCVNPRHLRAVTSKQNNEHLRGARSNSKSGIRGVFWHKARRKWIVSVRHNGRSVHGGYFESAASAEVAAAALRRRLFTLDDYEEGAIAS